MKRSRFQDKLHKAQSLRGTNRALLMVPRLTKMPLPMQRYDDPFLPFGKAIIAATQDLVCAYVFDLAAYLALGAAGAVALERTIASVDDDTVTILHGPFTRMGYVAAAQALGVDAVTLEDEEESDAYRAAGLGAFVVGTQIDYVLVPMGSSLQILLADEHIIEAGHGDDFAEQIREALQA